jgi:hypothetical protein
MTETLRRAAHNTKVILDHADRARELLAGGGPRSNDVGVLVDPGDYRGALEAARELIDQAIAVHGATNWPDQSDYHAL